MSAETVNFYIDKTTELTDAAAQVFSVYRSRRRVQRIGGEPGQLFQPIADFIIGLRLQMSCFRRASAADETHMVLQILQAAQNEGDFGLEFTRFGGAYRIVNNVVYYVFKVSIVFKIVRMHYRSCGSVENWIHKFKKFIRVMLSIINFRLCSAEVVKDFSYKMRPVATFFFEGEKAFSCLLLVRQLLQFNLPNKRANSEYAYPNCADASNPAAQSGYPFAEGARFASEYCPGDKAGEGGHGCRGKEGHPVVEGRAFHPAFLAQPQGLREAA